MSLSHRIDPPRGGSTTAEHPMHIAVKKILEEMEIDSLVFKFDTACEHSDEPEHHRQLPLYVERERSLVTKYCQVDALALKTVDGELEVAVIIEIEETGINQIKILGKVLASALCRFYIHDEEEGKPIPISKNALFIQIIRETDESEHKRKKWNDIEERVNGVLPIEGSRICRYRLIHGSLEDFERGGRGATSLRSEIEAHLERERMS